MQIKVNVQVVRGASTPRSRGRRVAVAAAVAAAALAAPFAYAAVRNDVFSDVPSSAADHDAINRVYNAGIMSPCATSPSLQFCPNNTVLRRGVAKQYDYALGLSGVPGHFTPTFQSVNVKTGGFAPPLTVDSAAKVTNLNVDLLDGKDSTDFVNSTDVLFANVSSGGTLIGGDATGSVQTSTGHYSVTFARNVQACAPVVSGGFTNNTGGSTDLVAGATAHSGTSAAPSTVIVQFYRDEPPSYPAENSAFHLVVVC